MQEAVLDSPAKHPGRVVGGREGARRRWGPPRTIDLRDLPSEQRAFIAELVDVARRNAAQREPAA